MRPTKLIIVNSTNIDIFHLFSGVLSVARASLVHYFINRVDSDSFFQHRSLYDRIKPN